MKAQADKTVGVLTPSEIVNNEEISYEVLDGLIVASPNIDTTYTNIVGRVTVTNPYNPLQSKTFEHQMVEPSADDDICKPISTKVIPFGTTTIQAPEDRFIVVAKSMFIVTPPENEILLVDYVYDKDYYVVTIAELEFLHKYVISEHILPASKTLNSDTALLIEDRGILRNGYVGLKFQKDIGKYSTKCHHLFYTKRGFVDVDFFVKFMHDVNFVPYFYMNNVECYCYFYFPLNTVYMQTGGNRYYWLTCPAYEDKMFEDRYFDFSLSLDVLCAINKYDNFFGNDKIEVKKYIIFSNIHIYSDKEKAIEFSVYYNTLSEYEMKLFYKALPFVNTFISKNSDFKIYAFKALDGILTTRNYNVIPLEHIENIVSIGLIKQVHPTYSNIMDNNIYSPYNASVYVTEEEAKLSTLVKARYVINGAYIETGDKVFAGSLNTNDEIFFKNTGGYLYSNKYGYIRYNSQTDVLDVDSSAGIEDILLYFKHFNPATTRIYGLEFSGDRVEIKSAVSTFNEMVLLEILQHYNTTTILPSARVRNICNLTPSINVDGSQGKVALKVAEILSATIYHSTYNDISHFIRNQQLLVTIGEYNPIVAGKLMAASFSYPADPQAKKIRNRRFFGDDTYNTSLSCNNSINLMSAILSHVKNTGVSNPNITQFLIDGEYVPLSNPVIISMIKDISSAYNQIKKNDGSRNNYRRAFEIASYLNSELVSIALNLEGVSVWDPERGVTVNGNWYKIDEFDYKDNRDYPPIDPAPDNLPPPPISSDVYVVLKNFTIDEDGVMWFDIVCENENEEAVATPDYIKYLNIDDIVIPLQGEING